MEVLTISFPMENLELTASTVSVVAEESTVIMSSSMLVTNEPTPSNSRKETATNAIIQEKTTVASATWESTTEMALVTGWSNVGLTDLTEGEVSASTASIPAKEATIAPESQEVMTNLTNEKMGLVTTTEEDGIA